MLVIHTGNLDFSKHKVTPDEDDSLVEVKFNSYNTAKSEISFKVTDPNNDIESNYSLEVMQTINGNNFDLKKLTENQVIAIRLVKYKDGIYAIKNAIVII